MTHAPDLQEPATHSQVVAGAPLGRARHSGLIVSLPNDAPRLTAGALLYADPRYSPATPAAPGSALGRTHH